MKYLASLAAVAVAGLSLTATAPSFATTQSDYPTLVTVNGSGCDGGTPLDADLDVYGNVWNVTYTGDTFTAVAGTNVSKTASRRNCQLNLKADMPEGYTYAVKNVKISGDANLSDSAIGKISLHTYFQGKPGTKTSESRLTRGYQGQFVHSENFADSDLMWAPCGGTRNINLNTALHVLPADKNAKPEGTLSLASGGRMTVEITTKRC